MCRLAGYIGEPIPLQSLIIEPEHSLIEQSLEAQEAKLSVNGDGFGVAWHDELDEPGVFKHTQPAWSDQNLLSIARHIRAPSILAHVRAATDGAIIHTNCHPFAHGTWAFAHNGQIGGFAALRRTLENVLPDHLYNARQGTTDSELLFFLLLHFGLDRDPVSAVEETIALVARTAQSKGEAGSFKFTALCSTRDCLVAIRYASKGHAPTLYCSWSMKRTGVVVASEPLTPNKEQWTPIDGSSVLVLDGSALTSHALAAA